MAPRDWRNPDDYADLQDLDLSGLAWEFLRRNPLYRIEHDGVALGARALAARWGLRFALNPDMEARVAPLFWRAEVAPAHVVVLTASTLGGLDRAALAALSVATREAAEGLHLRFPNGLQALAPATLGPGVPLAAEAALDAVFPVRLTALGGLDRLLAGRGAGPDPLPPLSRYRLPQMVRSLDARAAGASYRDIAEGVLGRAAEAAAWRTSAARDVAIRLLRSARRLAGGGYRGLLLRRR